MNNNIEQSVCVRHSSSLLGALSHGASQGLKMASNVVINQIVYIALLEFLNMTLMWFAERVGVEGFTFSVSTPWGELVACEHVHTYRHTPMITPLTHNKTL